MIIFNNILTEPWQSCIRYLNGIINSSIDSEPEYFKYNKFYGRNQIFCSQGKNKYSLHHMGFQIIEKQLREGIYLKRKIMIREGEEYLNFHIKISNLHKTMVTTSSIEFAEIIQTLFVIAS